MEVIEESLDLIFFLDLTMILYIDTESGPGKVLKLEPRAKM